MIAVIGEPAGVVITLIAIAVFFTVKATRMVRSRGYRTTYLREAAYLLGIRHTIR